MPYGYAIYRAESRPSPALQRDADRQLGQLFAALSRRRPWRAGPVRAPRRPVPVLAAPEAGERTCLSRA
jgi:hypothetical protein